MWSWIALTIVALGLLLLSEHRDHRLGKWLTKPVASAGFVGLGLAAGAQQGFPGHVMLVGLLLCMLGDVLLIGKGRASFLAGLVAFLLGHLAYAVAFGFYGLDHTALAATAVVLALVAVPVLRWLWPHVPGPMRVPVAAYVLVISVMVATSVGVWGAGASGLLPVGALLFYLSDLAVARNRFVTPGSVNRLVGLPLYYAGQLVIASQLASLA